MASRSAQLNHSDQIVTITHFVQDEGGKYVAELPDERATGYLEWEPGDYPNVRIATHTVVPPAIGGRGVAARLVERLVADARAGGFRIVPQCWYVAKKFDENPEWAGLRA